MRYIIMLLGLALIGLSGLWFFTPVLDSTYSRYIPTIAHSHSQTGSLKAPTGTATRSAIPPPNAAAAPSASSSASQQIGNKALADNLMSMINLGTGILGAWFTYMSYRLQANGRRRDD